MTEHDPDRYRPNVGLALFHKTGLVFLGKRAGAEGTPYSWQMPQGGMDAGETPAIAAFRELQEETGVAAKHVRLLEELPDWLYYDVPTDTPGAARFRARRFAGQRQKWFAFRSHGRDSDIRLDAHTPEFSDWRWAPLDQAVDLVIPFKRAVYEEVARRFAKYASGGTA